MKHGKPIHFIAVGNPLYGDDGAGLAVLNALQQLPEYGDAVFYDAHTDALSILDHFTADGLNFIIDAAKMKLTPGTVISFKPEEARLKIQWDHLSIHGFGLAETCEMAEKIGVMPQHLVLIGIEPEIIQIDKPLSDTVRDAVPKAITLINKEVSLNESTNHSDH